jgi:hypothetical protein
MSTLAGSSIVGQHRVVHLLNTGCKFAPKKPAFRVERTTVPDSA